MPTPNMSLVLPTDHDSDDIWGVILATLFGLVDAHDHTTGKGVKVPSGALNINADVSWSSGGAQYAITDLRAIDFSPQPASGMVSLAAALFLNSADSELYYRTTAGTNVKVTNGAALNVAAFTGGIGGDYAAAGALVVFDDATDSYWFQQQVGAAVRQYARMRSADVDLYEFKANPAAGVPTNRVRLASPAALAASYALTFPGALPAARSSLLVDAAGAVSTMTTVLMFQAGLAQFNAVANGTQSFDGVAWSLGTNGGGQGPTCPIIIPVGSTFTTWTAHLSKATNGAVTVTARLFDVTLSTGASAQVGATQSSNANAPGALPLTGAGTVAQAGHVYYIEVDGGGIAGDKVFGWSVTV